MQFRDSMIDATRHFPIDETLVHISLESNSDVSSPNSHFSGVPDVMLTASLLSKARESDVYVIIECAFTQTFKNVQQKLRQELGLRPEVILAVIISIEEGSKFESPKQGSKAWEFFSGESQSKENFLAAHQAPVKTLNGESFSLGPIIIAEHAWCDIKAVEYHVWKRQDSRIDIDQDAAVVGVGSFYEKYFHFYVLICLYTLDALSCYRNGDG